MVNNCDHESDWYIRTVGLAQLDGWMDVDGAGGLQVEYLADWVVLGAQRDSAYRR